MSNRVTEGRYVSAYQLRMSLANGEEAIYNFDSNVTHDEAYTQYASFVELANKSKKAKSIELYDLVKLTTIEKTEY